MFYRTRNNVSAIKFRRFENAVVPQATYAKLKYKTDIPFIWTAAGTLYWDNVFRFRCNSPFDPDAVVGNASAQGFDYFRDYYQNYIVTRSKIIVKFRNIANAYFRCAVVPVYGQTTQLPPASERVNSEIMQVTNLPHIKWKTIGWPNGTKSVCTVGNSWNIWKDQGLDSTRGDSFERSTFAATTSESPVSIRAYNIIMQTTTGAAFPDAALAAYLSVTVTYHTKFYGRKQTAEIVDPE